MNDIIKRKNILIDTLFSESQRIIKASNEYISSFSPDIFGRQKPQSYDEENYFKLYREVSSVSDTFSNAAVTFSNLCEEVKAICANTPTTENRNNVEKIHKCSLLCSVANEQCFSPYLCGIYEVLALDSENRPDVNVGKLRNLTHGFSVNLNEFIHNLEGQK